MSKGGSLGKNDMVSNLSRDDGESEIDWSLIEINLQKTPTERIQAMSELAEFITMMQQAPKVSRD